MSGQGVGRAIERRFDQVRRSETERLQRKLARLSGKERESAEEIIGDVIAAVARVAASALVKADHQPTLEAIVRLFNLEPARADAEDRSHR
jgi:hypothetical protein